MLIFKWSFVVAVVVGPVIARADCTGLKEIQEAMKKAPQSQVAFFTSFLQKNPPPPCNAAKAVILKVTSAQKPADFRLEPPRPFDRQKAQLNLDRALLAPRVKQRLDDAAKGEDDEKQRLAFEAAILFDEGYFGASELKSLQLQELLK